MGFMILGVAGVLASGGLLFYLKGRVADWRPDYDWLLGLAALFPLWLVAFLGLLQPITERADETPLPPQALISSGALLAGVIVTDYLLRRLQKSGRVLPAPAIWIVGLLALVPACYIALVGF